jgi:hypothetical protein
LAHTPDPARVQPAAVGRDVQVRRPTFSPCLKKVLRYACAGQLVKGFGELIESAWSA